MSLTQHKAVNKKVCDDMQDNPTTIMHKTVSAT